MTDPHAPDPSPRETAHGLGARLREVRTARGLSVRELARRAGCSPSLVSQVERGVTAPSAGVLYALANELEISLDYLFGNRPGEPTPAAPGSGQGTGQPGQSRPVAPWGRATGPDGEGILQRAGDRSAIELSSGVRWERITPQHDARVDFLEVVYEPEGHSSDSGRSVRHDGREYLLILEGRLEARVGFETYLLEVGDSLAFDPTTPHQYRNPTNGITRVASVIVHDAGS
jgi:transcriptional regulator with XRE-family HTH domain